MPVGKFTRHDFIAPRLLALEVAALGNIDLYIGDKFWFQCKDNLFKILLRKKFMSPSISILSKSERRAL